MIVIANTKRPHANPFEGSTPKNLNINTYPLSLIPRPLMLIGRILKRSTIGTMKKYDNKGTFMFMDIPNKATVSMFMD